MMMVHAKKSKLFLIVIMVTFCTVIRPSLAIPQDKIDKVKAVFLFKFFDYTSWPDENSPSLGRPARLCVFGPHSFGSSLSYIAEKKSASVIYDVSSINNLYDVSHCHIVYFSPENYSKLRELDGQEHILTVGDGRGFIEAGGAVELRLVGEKIKIRVNLENLKQQNIKLSARLLDIADVIR